MTTRTDNAEASIHAEPPETYTVSRLELLSGRRRGRSFAVPAAGLLLGRQSEPAALAGADDTVSRRHARLYFSDQGQPFIEDLGSANGTFLNGHRVSAPKPLRDQDIITVGNVELRFAARPASAAEPDQTRQLLEDQSQLPSPGHPVPPISQAPATPVQPVSLPEPRQGLQQTLKEPPDHRRNREPPGYAESLARYRAGDVTTALELLTACHRHDPGHFGTLYGLGVCYSRLGDCSRARHWLAAAQAIDPRHPGVAEAIKALDHAVPQPAVQHHLITNTPRVSQAEPRPQNAMPGPRRKPSLAHELDGDAPVDAGCLPGKLIRRGHRRLLSHKRLYIGIIALLAAIAAAKARSAISASRGAPAPAAAVLTGSGYAYLVLAILGIVGAMLSQALTHYAVYERRVDISHGVLFRKHQMIWLYDVLDIELVQSPLLMLAGTGTLILQTDRPPKPSWVPPRKSSMPQLRAFGPISRLRKMQQELLAMVEVERRSMKKNWI